MAEITSDAVIGFAKQGHPQAIAVLLNRVLVPKGAHVKVRQKEELLKVLINFLRETELDQLVDRVQDTFNDLSPENVKRVQIFTQRLGDRQASFQKEIVTSSHIAAAQAFAPEENKSVNPEFGHTAQARSLTAKKGISVHKAAARASQNRYSVAEFLSQVSSVEDLEVLEDHPFFTGVCPRCSREYLDLENPPLFWDCNACGWQDDLSQKIPDHQLRETPQRRKIYQGKRLGSYLVEAGLLTPAQIEVALADQQLTGIRLGEVLVRRGWIKEETVEYFMRKVVEPERQASTGKAEAYLESSRNLLKTLIHQNKSNASKLRQVDIAFSASETIPSLDSDVGQTPVKPKSPPINSKETLILSDVDVPPTTAIDPATAVNERETLLLPDLDMHLLDQD